MRFVRKNGHVIPIRDTAVAGYNANGKLSNRGHVNLDNHRAYGAKKPGYAGAAIGATAGAAVGKFAVHSAIVGGLVGAAVGLAVGRTVGAKRSGNAFLARMGKDYTKNYGKKPKPL